MAKYITFTVTPADGSPYEFWINADAMGNTMQEFLSLGGLPVQLTGANPYAIFWGGGSKSFINDVSSYGLYAVPVGPNPAQSQVSAGHPLLWYSKAIDKARSSSPDQIFVEADGLPVDGISKISGVCPTV